MQQKTLADNLKDDAISLSLNLNLDKNDNVKNVTCVETTASESKFTESLELEQESSTLIQNLNAKLIEFTKLAHGWDGYSGIPLPLKNAKVAESVLKKIIVHRIPEPSVVPGGDGAVQIEWHINNFDLEFTVSRFGELRAWRYNVKSEVESEIRLDEMEKESFFSTLSSWVSDLSKVKNSSNISN